jgi:excisionase family DNA binding protein
MQVARARQPTDSTKSPKLVIPSSCACADARGRLTGNQIAAKSIQTQLDSTRMNVSWDDEFLTVMQFAEHLQLNQQTVRNWIDAGELPAVRIGRRVRVRRVDLDELLAQGATKWSDRPVKPADKSRDEAHAFKQLATVHHQARQLLGRRSAVRRAELAAGLQDLVNAVEAALEQLPDARADVPGR